MTKHDHSVVEEHEIVSLSPEARRKAAQDLRGRIEYHLGPGTRAWQVAKRTAIGAWHDGFIHAGNLAYLAMLSIFPFFILGAAVFSLFGEQAERAAAINTVLLAVPPMVANVIQPVALNVVDARSGWLLWVGALVALWTVGSLVETIRDILRRAYGTVPTRAFWKNRLLSTLAILGTVLLLMLALIAQVTIGAAQQMISAYFPQLLDRIAELRLSQAIPALVVFGSLYATFLGLTPTRYRRRRYPKWPGALITTLWWMAATTLMPPLVRQFFTYDLTYGGLAGVMIAMFFFWLVGLGVVIGAELNAALAESPEEELSHIGQDDEPRRAALTKEMEEEEHAA
ncbi:YihY/virulence factor BrkB family protein [Erythrobacter mangrovi]|uniref:YihY/virulence factor BrkB family protein n=1 Tax=Erythrobacter mangrovi TaxID=2739433 RepID=A0A7D4BAG1_9SPHN|nr:YihY/virulence factor BrkB family protein [Erythrobacter mangrovi]QKG70946.1 YihY/virulence factor BrkB family protein [Erythrobacter mangrovi]